MEALILEGIYAQVVNFALQQNQVPMVKRLILKNMSDAALTGLEVVLSSQPAFALEHRVRVAHIGPGESLELSPIGMKLSPEYLFELTERILGVLQVQVLAGETVLAGTQQEVEVLAYDEWSGSLHMPEMAAAFITPNHPVITQVVAKAGLIMEKWTAAPGRLGNPSFTGYQSKNPNQVRLQMAALYSALQSENIAYIVPPASFEAVGQRVRLCDSLMADRMGTCLDLTLLYCACMEAVGIHPLVIFTRGHAFAGGWLEEECFSESVQEDVSLITKRVAEGINEICLVETTALTAGKNLSFDEAVLLAGRHLEDGKNFELLVDVKRTRGSGIRPMPMRLRNERGEFIALQDSSTRQALEHGTVEAPSMPEIHKKLKAVDRIPVTRQQIWERKLLDLSLRNTLVSFRVTQNAIQLMAGNLHELEDALSSGLEFQIMAKPKDWENTLRDSKIFEVQNKETVLETIAKTEFENRRIRTFIEEGEVALRITSLYRQAKLRLEENGSNTLYMALGFLRWYESEASEKARYAPLVLLPIDIIRKSAQKGYVIRIRDEEPQMNITLLEMLRQDFGLTIGGLDPLPEDEKGVDLKRVFNILRQAVMDKARWDVEELAFIGLFSFSQFVMWNDIRNRAEDLRRNKVVSSLLSGRMEWVPNSDFPQPDRLDEQFKPSDLAVPISADSSQLAAICAAGAGNSFVLHGPPGTGKSQTITNIIANALFQGKSVLFIAEKMAALSVVQKRLAAIGLGPFCLELHSNKAKKKDVLAQMEQVLELGRKASPEGYLAEAERLYQLRQRLNQVVDAVHKPQVFGFSLHEALVQLEAVEDAPTGVRFDASDLEGLTPQKLIHRKDLVMELMLAGEACGGAWNHPLSRMRRVSYSQNLKETLKSDLNACQSALGRFRGEVAEIENQLGIGHSAALERIEALMDFLEAFGTLTDMPAALLSYKELTPFKETLDQVCLLGLERDALEGFILKDFSEAFLEQDGSALQKEWHEAAESWFLAKMMGESRLKKEIRRMARKPEALSKENIEEGLARLTAYQQLNRRIGENGDLFAGLYGLLWKNGRPDWARLQVLHQHALKINRLLNRICDLPGQKQAILLDPMGLKEKLDGRMSHAGKLFDELAGLQMKISRDTGIDFSDAAQAADWFRIQEEDLIRWMNNLETLRSWSTYLVSRGKAESAGLMPLITAYESGQVKTDALMSAYSRGLYHACAMQIVENEPVLRQFSGIMFEGEIEKYRQTCETFEGLTRQELIARLSAKIPPVSANVSDSSEVGMLLKAIRSGGRMVSIRKLFDSIPSLLRRLCPCMLMSPISVAQYIDPKYPPFDLVVFDEASQLPTSEAVGAIARGEHVIVVGDPKQLPPTSFFASDRTDEDNYEVEDLESILDDCMAIAMPQTHLLWHYRSRHESLIAFSNRQYYENKLFTFPSPNDLISRVRYVPVPGYYDRGRTKQNRAEAEAVVAEISRRLRSPECEGQSMGVVTFSSVQQNLIDDLLVEAFAGDPELETLSNALYEPLFIKNLENVQGDERDVILFSVGYGPDEQGRTALNFGPLNRDGGWRRLNVAVSRARREMVVYSTLKPEQIDLSRTSAQGVAGLKAFLEYAQKGRDGLPIHISQQDTLKDQAQKQVADKLRRMGFQVNTHIGSSQYKIDIGIVHPEKPGTYILGILCDGHTYNEASTARDRNILQTQVLRGLGWNLHRLWILDWWEDREGEMKKIKAAVEAALDRERDQIRDQDQRKGQFRAEAQIRESSQAREQVQGGSSTGSEGGLTLGRTEETGKYEALTGTTAALVPTTYHLTKLEPMGAGAEVFMMPENRKRILAQIDEVLKAEAPISRNQLTRRILGSWGIARSGSRIDGYLTQLIREAGVKRTQVKDVAFLWHADQNVPDYRQFRVPSNEAERRSLEDICPQEIAGAIRHILNIQISLSRPDLIREVFKLFGFSRGSAAMEAAVLAGLGIAQSDGVIIDETKDRVTGV